jgi:hypothetical protein
MNIDAIQNSNFSGKNLAGSKIPIGRKEAPPFQFALPFTG